MQSMLEKMEEKVLIGAFVVPLEELASEERCRRIKDMGVDFVYAEIGERHEHAQQVLDQCEKCGVKVLAFDPKADRMPMDRYWALEDAVSDYIRHPALWGTVLRDEPGIYDLPRLGLLAKTYLEFGGKKLPIINLFPCYANQRQLNGVTYREYLERYVQEVDLPYLSYDHYPLYGKGDKTWIQDAYLSNFEMAADACRAHGRQLWYFIQTLGFNHILREPGEQDIRWQVYCALSFGVRAIQLFTYGSPGDENGDTETETFELGLIDRQGEKTPRYDMVQRVLEELRRLEGAYLSYGHEGNMVYEGEAGPEVGEIVEITFPGEVFRKELKRDYLKLEHPLASFGPICGIKGDGPLMAGCFSHGEKRAFTLVNMTDPGKGLSNEATVAFSQALDLRLWRHGEPQELKAGEELSLCLASGEGVFVEIS